MVEFAELRPQIGIAPACVAMSINRAVIYRTRDRLARRHWATLRRQRRPRPPLALSGAERSTLWLVLNSERFAALAPAAVYAILLDEGRYHGSVHTMYRLLAAQGLSGERRKQRAHTAYTKPELLAVRPREVWSWDITKLKGPAKWTCFHLYVILDIFSRYIVGWMIAVRQSAEFAKQFIADTVHKERIRPGSWTPHADPAAPACARSRWRRSSWTWT